MHKTPLVWPYLLLHLLLTALFISSKTTNLTLLHFGSSDAISFSLPCGFEGILGLDVFGTTLDLWEPELVDKCLPHFLSVLVVLRYTLHFFSFPTILRDTQLKNASSNCLSLLPCDVPISLPEIASQVYYLYPSLSLYLCFQDK